MKKLVLFIIIAALAGGGYYYYRNHSNKGAQQFGRFSGPNAPGGMRQDSSRRGDGQTSGTGDRRGGPRANNAGGTETQAQELPPGTPDENGNVAKSTRAKRDKIELTVNTTGLITAYSTVEIKSKASGTIINLPFDISDHVTTGALLCELDPVDENRNVQLSEVSLMTALAKTEQSRQNLELQKLSMATKTTTTLSNLESARIKFDDLKTKYARSQALYDRQLISKEEFDTSYNDFLQSSITLQQQHVAVEDLKREQITLASRETDVKLAEASTLQSSVSLELARQRLADCKIFAPTAGVIVTRTVQSGQIIASAVSNVGGGSVLMTIADTSRLFVDANVDEVDIGKVKVGQNVIIRADAFIGKQFEGKVVRVAAQGDNKSSVVTFPVRIEVIGKAGLDLLRPQMTAVIDIEADRRSNVITLPNEAIQMYRGENYVEIPARHGDGNTSVTVVTGLTDGLKTEIVSGLEEGQEVMYPGALVSKWSKPAGANFGQSMQRAAMMNRGGRR